MCQISYQLTADLWTTSIIRKCHEKIWVHFLFMHAFLWELLRWEEIETVKLWTHILVGLQLTTDLRELWVMSCSCKEGVWKCWYSGTAHLMWVVSSFSGFNWLGTIIKILTVLLARLISHGLDMKKWKTPEKNSPEI